jgi:hypothetical protein
MTQARPEATTERLQAEVGEVELASWSQREAEEQVFVVSSRARAPVNDAFWQGHVPGQFLCSGRRQLLGDCS